MTFERMIEGDFRSIPDSGGDFADRQVRLAQEVLRQLHSPACQGKRLFSNSRSQGFENDDVPYASAFRKVARVALTMKAWMRWLLFLHCSHETRVTHDIGETASGRRETKSRK